MQIWPFGFVELVCGKLQEKPGVEFEPSDSLRTLWALLIYAYPDRFLVFALPGYTQSFKAFDFFWNIFVGGEEIIRTSWPLELLHISPY